jgi:hypothetical protein
MPKNPSKFEDLCGNFSDAAFVTGVVVVDPLPVTQAEGQLIIVCLLLLVQQIYICPPYLEVISSNRNLNLLHAVVTRSPHNKIFRPISKMMRCC